MKTIFPLLTLIFLALSQNSVGEKSSASIAFAGISPMPHLLLGSSIFTEGLNLRNTSGIAAPSSLLTGIVSYWSLDEASGNAIDAAGGGDNGTSYNVTQNVTGKINKAYAFNGTNSYIDIGNKSNLSLTSSGSISAWIYPTNITHMGMIVSKGNAGNDLNGFNLGFLYNTLYWELANSTTHLSGGYTIAGHIVNNTWYLVTLTWDGSHVNLYLNGAAVTAPVAQTVTPVSSLYSFRIGARGDYLGSTLFQGTIDEVGAWNRALSSTEVTGLYNAGAGLQYPFSQVTANAGNSLVLNAGVTATTLTGTGTAGTSVTYVWTKTAGGSATIISPTSASTSVTGLAAGTYTFLLTVTDNAGNTATSSVNVTVNSSSAPTSSAGANQTLNPGITSTTLTGTGTGTSITYAWTKTSGGSATITNPSSASTSVTGLTAGSSTFNLQVTDPNTDATANSSVQITVSSSGSTGSTQLNHGNNNPYTVSGQTYNLQSANNDYNGVIADRSSQYQFNFLHNYITSNVLSGGGGAGYMLQFGTEGPTPGYTWNLNNMVISGNYLNWTGGYQTPQIQPHGIFAAYNINDIITYNYIYQVPMAIIQKSDGTNNNDNSANRNSKGAIAYNIIYNPMWDAINIKGMSNTNIFNNTFYSSVVPAVGIIDIYDNTGTNGVGFGTHIFNNIFYSTSTSVFNIHLETSDCLTGFQSDYNLFYCGSGTPMFKIGSTSYTFSQWQALGYDTHSVVANPNFNNFTDFVPSAPLNYGTNLGAIWQTGLAANAIWSTSAMPATANQGSTWQVGARVISLTGSLTASAGTNQTLSAGTASTVLNASASESNVTYSWTQTSGTAATISTPSSATTTVIGLTVGTYTFLITVSDNSGNTATSSNTVSVNSSSTSAPGLISFWTFDEKSGNAIDVGGGGNNGTPASVTQNVTGKINTAYSFNGTNSYVDMGNKANLSLTTSGSISAWIYPTDVTHMGMIVSKGNSGSDRNGYNLGFLYNTLYWELANSATRIQGSYSIAGHIVNNTWYLVTLTWDGSNVNLYLNGVAVTAPVAQTVTPVSGVYPFRIGARGDYLGSMLFQGTIDEVGVWSSALTSATIATLYNSGVGMPYPFQQITAPAAALNLSPLPQISSVGVLSINAYPNPYSSQINFHISASSGGRGSLELYDVLGRKVATVFEGDLAEGEDRTVQYNLGAIPPQPLIYIFTIGDQIIHGKLIPGGH
jgi:hypothetical protein